MFNKFKETRKLYGARFNCDKTVDVVKGFVLTLNSESAGLAPTYSQADHTYVATIILFMLTLTIIIISLPGMCPDDATFFRLLFNGPLGDHLPQEVLDRSSPNFYRKVTYTFLNSELVSFTYICRPNVTFICLGAWFP